jgi:voltage-gated potassium channel
MALRGLQSMSSTREWVRDLYEGDTPRAHQFRYGLVAFDFVTLAFIVATSFFSPSPTLERIDIVFGIVIGADLIARLTISERPWRELLNPFNWADFVAMLSFLAPIAREGAGFLRVLRTLRLLRTYRVLARLRQDSRFFRTHEDVAAALVNLIVFVFIMTGIVYATQHDTNPAIGNYADALYFTVTALTTTGFGDITLPGTPGRMITVIIMIFGVTLFLRLAQVLFRPNKVSFPCPTCGLQRHDYDAVHCKACGQVLNIPNDEV